MSLSPLEGRYRSSVTELDRYFSEDALLKIKVDLEAFYTARIISHLGLPIRESDAIVLNYITQGRSFKIERIKEIEKSTNHDIKAIELYVAENISEACRNYVHFGLTSQDINSPAYSISLRRYKNEVLYAELDKVVKSLLTMSKTLYPVTIPGRTHGQIAVPTRLGKEIAVYAERLTYLNAKIDTHQMTCKMGGACGNLSAHYSVRPDIDWEKFFDDFVGRYSIKRESLTTQVSGNLSIAELFQMVSNTALVLIDLCRDMWMYYSYGYFTKRSRSETVGSSTMPQKANPIEFENAEGNFELAVNLLNFMANKIQTSRLQRDLSDSTVFRNMGVAFGYFHVGLSSLVKGLQVSEVRSEKAQQEVDENYTMGGEWLQTELRLRGDTDPYYTVKKLTETADRETWDRECLEKVGKKFDPAEYSRNRVVETLK
jgi:adenylosuccinate lyase